MSDTARAIQENSVLRWKARQDQKIIHEQRLEIRRLKLVNSELLTIINNAEHVQEQLEILEEGE